jgi:hypothetical protein
MVIIVHGDQAVHTDRGKDENFTDSAGSGISPT